MSTKKEEGPGLCVGGGGIDEGCGFVGGESGDTCPDCGGMILSKEAIKEAEDLQRTWNKWDKEEAEKNK